MNNITTKNYDWKKQRYEKNKGIHATIPDQSYTIKQILDRFVKGQPINNMVAYNVADYQKGEIIDYESELKYNKQPDPLQMDLTERKQYEQQAKNEINKLNEKHKNKHKKNDEQNSSTTQNNENQRNKQEDDPAK